MNIKTITQETETFPLIKNEPDSINEIDMQSDEISDPLLL